MDFSYIVKIKVRDTVYPSYKRWLHHHIEGNAALGVRGMMEIRHEGRFLFPSVEVYTTDPIGDFHLLTVKYFTDDLQKINTYMAHYASEMRGEMPEEFHSNIAFNRFISNGRSVRPLGDVNKEMEALYNEHAERSYNLASFEVYS